MRCPIPRDRMWVTRARGREGEMGLYCLMGTDFQFGTMEVLEIHGADGCTIMWIYGMPLNYTLKNSLKGTFYDMHILPQFLKLFKKHISCALKNYVFYGMWIIPVKNDNLNKILKQRHRDRIGQAPCCPSPHHWPTKTAAPREAPGAWTGNQEPTAPQHPDSEWLGDQGQRSFIHLFLVLLCDLEQVT